MISKHNFHQLLSCIYNKYHIPAINGQLQNWTTLNIWIMCSNRIFCPLQQQHRHTLPPTRLKEGKSIFSERQKNRCCFFITLFLNLNMLIDMLSLSTLHSCLGFACADSINAYYQQGCVFAAQKLSYVQHKFYKRELIA